MALNWASLSFPQTSQWERKGDHLWAKAGTVWNVSAKWMVKGKGLVQNSEVTPSRYRWKLIQLIFFSLTSPTVLLWRLCGAKNQQGLPLAMLVPQPFELSPQLQTRLFLVLTKL